MSGYKFYDTMHPDKKGHEGTSVLIRRTIRHYLLQNQSSLSLQATTICSELKDGNLVVSSVYCPPDHQLSASEIDTYFSGFSHKFIAAGDFNAKNLIWGLRLTTSRGRLLYNSITLNGCDVASCGQPTYWPTDRRKIPDFIDFPVTNNIYRNKMTAVAVSDLSSDHTSVILE